MQLTVTGDIGTFKGGQLLKRDKDIIAYYRTIANEGRETPIELTDDALFEAIESVEGDDEDAEQSRIDAIEAALGNTNEDALAGQVAVAEHVQQQEVSDRQPTSAVAFTLGSQVGGDEAINKLARGYVTAAETTKQAKQSLRIELVRVLGREKMLSLPVPGTKTGNNPEKITRPSTVKGNKPVTTYFYSEMADGSPFGKEITEAIKQVDIALTSPSEAVQPWKSMHAQELGVEKKMWAARATALHGLYKGAVANFWQMEAFAEHLDDIKVEDVMVVGSDKKTLVPKRTTYCIRITDKRDQDFRNITVADLMAYRPKAASDKFGRHATLADLDATKAKKQVQPVTPEGTKETWDLDTFEDNVAAQAMFFQDKENVAALYAATAKDEGLLLSTGDAYLALHRWWLKFGTQYEATKDAKEKAEEAIKNGKPAKAA